MKNAMSVDAKRKRFQISFKDEKRITIQDAKNDCDINTIIKRLGPNGQLPPKVSPDVYVDATALPSDYRSALDLVLYAQDQFSALSADLRDKFKNDPENFLHFVNDPKNIDELVTLGLAKKTSPSENLTLSDINKTLKDLKTSLLPPKSGDPQP